MKNLMIICVFLLLAEMDYASNPYIEMTNGKLSVNSLNECQLNDRLKQIPFQGFLLMDKSLLEKVKHAVKSGDKNMKQVYEGLIAKAEANLLMPLPSVMQKKQTPPSGSKHDYMSLARYFWPNPDTPDGLPYVRKDGIPNPEIEDFDSDAVGKLMTYLDNLSLAYYFSGDERYAKRSVELIENWFLNPDTKMNPNLKYAQSIRGLVEGRGIGIIDTRNFCHFPDIMALLSESESITPQLTKGMTEWMTEYLDWLWNHPYGQDERNWKNNHGTAYDMQVVGIALFVGDIELARNVLTELPHKRIDSQIERDGKQPLELDRTLSYHYSVFNLVHLVDLAIMGEKTGIDIFGYTGPQGQSIAKALDYITPFIGNEEKWEYQQISSFKEAYGDVYEMLGKMAFYLDSEKYKQTRKTIDKNSRHGFESNLTFPFDFSNNQNN